MDIAPIRVHTHSSVGDRPMAFILICSRYLLNGIALLVADNGRDVLSRYGSDDSDCMAICYISK